MQKLLKGLFIIILLHFVHSVPAQTKNDIKQVKNKYEGTWFSKKENRFIKLTFEKESNNFTIRDWINGREEEMDIYKAYIKEDYLFLNADSSEHRAPYCKLIVTVNKLCYQCNNPFNVTDNFLNKNEASAAINFVRLSK